MLAKKFRLPVQSVVKKTGKSFRGHCFLLKVFSPSLNYGRAGVVISRKVSSKATDRNRLKRAIFNFLRENIQRMPVRDYLLIFLPAAGKAEKSELISELKKLLTTNY